VICVVATAFRVRTAQGETDLHKGQIISIGEAKAKRLLKAGKIEQLQPCRACQTFSWWLSVCGVLVCGLCHPPAAPTLVSRHTCIVV
jgi:hypothetical protein